MSALLLFLVNFCKALTGGQPPPPTQTSPQTLLPSTNVFGGVELVSSGPNYCKANEGGTQSLKAFFSGPPCPPVISTYVCTDICVCAHPCASFS